MNFLASEIAPSSDSEDDDYVPTEPTANPGALNIHKNRSVPGLQLEDDDDDSFNSDLHDTDLEDPAALVALHEAAGPAPLGARRERYSTGAGPSSTGAGPSSAGAGPSSAGAGPSWSGGGPSSAGAGPSSAGTGPSWVSAASSSAHAGPSSSSAGPSSSGGAPSSMGAGPSSAGAGPSAVVASCSASASVVAPVTVAEPTSTRAPVVANGSASRSASNPAIAEDGPSATAGEPPTKKTRVELAATEPSENENKKKDRQSIDDIWAEMNASTHPKKSVQPTAAATDPGLMGWLGGMQSPAPAKPFKVKRLDQLEREAKERERAEREAGDVKVEKKSRQTGLEAVLDIVRGPKKDGALDKTREVWSEFKEKDEEVENELESYKKDKDRYTDKVAFLERTDVREWEYEQSGKRKRR